MTKEDNTEESNFGTEGLGNIYELDTLRLGTVIPEPSSLPLLTSAFASLFGWGWCRKHKTASA